MTGAPPADARLRRPDDVGGAVRSLDALLTGTAPFLALVPMQEATDGAFWTLVHRYGGADVYWTEYFRVHADSTPEKRILHAIASNTTGRLRRGAATR